MPGATTYISEIQSAAHSIPQSISAESTRVPPIVVSLSESSPIPMSAPHINVIPEESSSFIESPLVQSDSTLGSPSSSATTRSQIALQVTSVLEAHVTGSITAVSGPGDTHGMDTRILMEDFPYSNQSTAPAPCINPVTLAPEDGKDGRN
ncbi:hypothetical protein BJV74DRAFT_860043 [Russula compacta]|nr:hypothetical protein BJV74DRAFT_860043 [Russula compacta]